MGAYCYKNIINSLIYIFKLFWLYQPNLLEKIFSIISSITLEILLNIYQV